MDAFKRNRIIILVILVCILTYFFGTFLDKMSNRDVGAIDVVLEVIVPKDDTFQLFYLEGSETTFTIPKSVRLLVKGSNSSQKIRFKLPMIHDLSKLRLDIGENFNQGPISIEGISFKKQNNTYNLNNIEFNNLFYPNKYVKILEDGFSYIGIKTKINASRTIYDPGFYTNEKSDEFKKVFNSRYTNYPFAISGFIFFVLAFYLLSNIDAIKLNHETLFIVAFFLIIVLPTVQKELQIISPLKSLEKRDLNDKPKFAWSTEYARGYEAYFNDNFGFRNHLVNWGSNLKTKFFKSSTYPELVTFGREKWLFYTRLKGRIYRSYSKTNLLSKDTLKLIVDKWEHNKSRFNQKNIGYFISFWPNKHTIYPEYLPVFAKIQIRDTISRVEQILKYLDSVESAIKLTDVRGTLLKEKEDNLLFHKFDSHWNSYGAFIAYQEFFKQNKEELGINPKTLNDFDVRWEEYNQGELIQMLGISNGGFFLEKNPIFTLKKDKNQIEYLPTDGFPRLTVITKNKKAGNKLRALVFRDSFSNSLVQFFSLHFYEVFYIWGFKEHYVDELSPNVVIDGFVEREIGEHVR